MRPLGVVAVVLTVAGSGCYLSHQRVDAADPPMCGETIPRIAADLGRRCVTGTDCTSGACRRDRSGLLRVCTQNCETDADCPSGWRCEPGTLVCECGTGVEVCSGRDEDCDGRVDEVFSAPLCMDGFSCRDDACRCDGPTVPAPTHVQLVVVVDDSAGSEALRARLAPALSRFLQALVLGELDDGTLFRGADSVQFSLLSTDMGSASLPIGSCDLGARGARLGDDGVAFGLRVTGGGRVTPRCEAFTDRIQPSDDPRRAEAFVACAMASEPEGCELEQPLEAALKAVSLSRPTGFTVPDYAAPFFVEGTSGHGDSFLDATSVLAILLVGDHDDCSIACPTAFDPAVPGPPPAVRCVEHDDALQPIERYVRGVEGRSGLLGVRVLPSRLVLGAITGLPSGADTSDLDALLATPEMTPTIDGDRVRPVCRSDAIVATPGRRIASVARGLADAGAGVALGSVCDPSYDPTLDALALRIGDALASTRCE